MHSGEGEAVNFQEVHREAMRSSEEGASQPSCILPLFAPASENFWQIILPGKPGVVYYIPEKE